MNCHIHHRAAMGRAVTVRDIKPQDFIVAYAAHLKTKDNFEVPKWADIVKTGRHKVCLGVLTTRS